MKRIGWENGTLVSKGKVSIGGNIYEVEPEQYEGSTPLSAENLKKMEDNMEEAINEVKAEAEEISNKLVKKVTLESNTTNLIIDGLDINTHGGTYEIIISGSKKGNIYIVPNGSTLEFSRNIITQTSADEGNTTGIYSGIVRYSENNGLWFSRGLDDIRILTTGILKYDKVSNLVTVNSQSGSIDVASAMLCNIYSVTRPRGVNNITSLRFMGTINAGSTIEIYKK